MRTFGVTQGPTDGPGRLTVHIPLMVAVVAEVLHRLSGGGGVQCAVAGRALAFCSTAFGVPRVTRCKQWSVSPALCVVLQGLIFHRLSRLTVCVEPALKGYRVLCTCTRIALSIEGRTEPNTTHTEKKRFSHATQTAAGGRALWQPQRSHKSKIT